MPVLIDFSNQISIVHLSWTYFEIVNYFVLTGLGYQINEMVDYYLTAQIKYKKTMSATSIQDQGYTPADFLQKLFRKPSTASSQNFFKPLSTISNLNSNTYHSSSQLIHLNQLKYSPTKLLRAHSMNQDQRISTKKFKIFYNTFMDGVFTQIESNEIWQKFEKSLNNPFQYDNFIEELRQIKDRQRQNSCQVVTNLADLNVQKIGKKFHSSQKQRDRVDDRNSGSLRKTVINRSREKEKVRKNVKYIRGILKHGQKFIKNK